MKAHAKNRRDTKTNNSPVRGARGGDRAAAKRAILADVR